ncbi:hypothetical protein ACLILZ_34620, partial [Mycobacterium paragordonae]
TIPSLNIASITTGSFTTPQIGPGNLTLKLPKVHAEFVAFIPNNFSLLQSQAAGIFPQIGGGVISGDPGKNTPSAGGPPAYIDFGPITINGLGFLIPPFTVDGFGLPALTTPAINIPSIAVPGFALPQISTAPIMTPPITIDPIGAAGFTLPQIVTPQF